MTFLYKQRFFRKSVLLTRLYNFWVNYLSPANFSYWWNFGSMALVCLILQIVTGIFLAMHYKSDFVLAFQTIEYISRNIQNGWLIRYMHAMVLLFFLL